MNRYRNSDDFARGLHQGVQFFGGMMDILDSRENRKRNQHREDLDLDWQATKRDRTKVGWSQDDEDRLDKKERDDYDFDEKKSRRELRDAAAGAKQERAEAERLKAINSSTLSKSGNKAGLYSPGGLGFKALEAGMQQGIDKAGIVGIKKVVAEKTSGAKITGANAAADSKASDARVKQETERDRIEAARLKVVKFEKSISLMQSAVKGTPLTLISNGGATSVKDLKSMYEAQYGKKDKMGNYFLSTDEGDEPESFFDFVERMTGFKMNQKPAITDPRTGANGGKPKKKTHIDLKKFMP